MKIKQLSLALLAASAMASAMSAHAGVYGRVTYNAVTGDTSNDDVQFQRHEFAESIIGVKGKADLVGGLTIGANVQYGLGEGLSTGAESNQGTLGNAETRTRIQEFYVSGAWGKLTLGQGVGVSYLMDSIDTSGTWLADPSGWLFVAGSGSASHRAAGTLTVAPTSTLFHERIRYDSPKLGGVATVAIQVGENGGTEVGIKGKYNGFRFAAFSNSDDAQFGDSSGIALGYKHGSGFSISGTSGTTSEGRGEVDVTTLKLGYATGKHAFSVQTYEHEDRSEAESLAYVYSAAKGIKLWARAVNSENAAGEDASTIAVGGMVKM